MCKPKILAMCNLIYIRKLDICCLKQCYVMIILNVQYNEPYFFYVQISVEFIVKGLINKIIQKQQYRLSDIYF